MIASPPPVPIAALVRKCASFARPKMMSAIVKVESGGNPYAIYDNTTGRRYLPANKIQATKILRQLISMGDKVDVGIAQIDTENFAYYNLNPDNAFYACTNINAGARILQAGYKMAVSAGYSGQLAFYHAFEAYNSGRLYGDTKYADAVLRAAGLPVYINVQADKEIAVYRPVPQSEYNAPFVMAWKPNGTVIVGQSDGAPAEFATAWSPS